LFIALNYALRVKNMIDKLPPGKNPPEDIYVVIEIPQGGNVKYELDKKTGLIFVDRFLYTAMFYPFNYGFIPQTLEEDGDPVDVLVVSTSPVAPGAVLRVKPIGLLLMEDEEGPDSKVIAVPIEKLDPRYGIYNDIRELPQSILDQIKHFFEHYKELEKGKWVRVTGWQDNAIAKKKIMEAMERYKASK